MRRTISKRELAWDALHQKQGRPAEDVSAEDGATKVTLTRNGDTWETEMQYVFRYSNYKTFRGQLVCYEHRETEAGYEYFLPSTGTGLYKSDLDD